MTDPIADASDADLAEQAVPVDDADEETGQVSEYVTPSIDADIADVLEQQRSVPVGDDDYDRG